MTTVSGKPSGYFEKILAMDSETSGLAFNGDDPSEGYQSVAWGLIVADAQTLEPIEKLKVLIKYDGVSNWSTEAEKVHGLSKEYLNEHGMTEEEAVTEIGNLIIKHWGPDGNIRVLGHNVITFDLPFFRRLFRKFGIELKFGNRHYDTNTLGFVLLQTYNSDQLFEAVGLKKRDRHDALTDAEYALETCKRLRAIWNKMVLGE